MTASEMYKQAYDMHYKVKDLENAFSLYCKILRGFPDSKEANYSNQQLKNIDVSSLDASKIDDEIADKFHELLGEKEKSAAQKQLEIENEKQIQAEIQKRQQELILAQEKTIAFFSDKTATYTIANIISFNKEKSVFALHSKKGYLQLHKFSDLIDFEVYEDGKTVVSSNSGSAALGALLFGVSGAIIGAAASQVKDEYVFDLHIRLIYNDIEQVMETIPLITKSVKKQSNQYKNALNVCESIVSALKSIIHNNKTDNKKNITVFSVADEIKKFKDLFDTGILTESEYLEQKDKLLKIDYNKIYFNE